MKKPALAFPANRRTHHSSCTDQVVGDILSGWRYDISGLSPAMRTEVMGDWPFAVRGDEGGDVDPWLESSLPVAPLVPGGVGDEEVPDMSNWAVVIAARGRTGPTALHTLDPLAERPRSRRGGAEEALRVEVPARPPRTRPSPRRSPAA